MTRLFVTLLLALGTTPLVAEPLPARWAYRTVVVGDPFRPGPADPVPGGPTLFAATTAGTGYAAAEFTAQDPWTPFRPGESVLASAVVVRAGTTGGGDFRAEFDADGPDGFYPGGYTMLVGVKDLLTGETAEFRFRGLFTGSVSRSRSGDLEYTFANRPVGPDPAAVTLGTTRIQAAWGDVTPPGIPYLVVGDDDSGGGVPGVSRVVVTTGAVAETPEPSTLVLAGLGVGLCGAGIRRRTS